MTAGGELSHGVRSASGVGAPLLADEIAPNFGTNPLFPALRSGHRLFQRPSHKTPFSPPSGLATGSFNGLHTESKFLAENKTLKFNRTKMTTIINNIFVILSPIVIMVSLAGEAKSATIAFIETTDSSAFQPNVISVGVVGEGLNTIQGSLNFTSDFPSSDSHDGYAFTVPIHLMITDVRIITGSNTTRRINNIIISSDGTTTPEWFDTPAASEIGSVDGNQNVAFVLNGGQLSAGTYFIGSRGGSWSISGIATYSYQIVAAPIPEPSSAALLLGGFGFAAVSLRKRKNRSTPFSPPSGPATGSFNGLHTESKFLSASISHSAPGRHSP